MKLQNFSWVIPNRLAGCAMPGFERGDNHAEWLAAQGVGMLVSLALPFGDPQKECADHGIKWVSYPIPDYHAPSNMATFTKLVDSCVDAMRNDIGVCAHCYAGIGRTGLLLACVIGKYFNVSSQVATNTLRNARPAIETPVQENFVRLFLDGETDGIKY